MIGFKGFIAIYLLIVVTGSALIVVAVPRFTNADTRNTINPSATHFSVRWMGFVPLTYSDQYPEYYVCINDLACETLYMPIAFRLLNQENSSFYFRVMQNQTPPEGWTLEPNILGLVNKDETKFFTYSALRTKPVSIPEGRLTETISLVVQAYYDSLYTQFYSQDSFTVTYNLLDRTAGAWTVLDNDNFDDGTRHDWLGTGYFQVTSDLYRSFPYSFASWYWSVLYKSFNISGSYSEAYVLCALRFPVARVDVLLNGVLCFQSDIDMAPATWYQFAIPLPTNQTTEVRFSCDGWRMESAYLDDVYVIAK